MLSSGIDPHHANRILTLKNVTRKKSLKIPKGSVKKILKLVLTYIFSTRDEGCFFSI